MEVEVKMTDCCIEQEGQQPLLVVVAVVVGRYLEGDESVSSVAVTQTR